MSPLQRTWRAQPWRKQFEIIQISLKNLLRLERRSFLTRALPIGAVKFWASHPHWSLEDTLPTAKEISQVPQADWSSQKVSSWFVWILNSQWIWNALESALRGDAGVHSQPPWQAVSELGFAHTLWAFKRSAAFYQWALGWLCVSPNPAQSFLQGLTVKWCQCWILHCALLRNVCPDFFSNKAWWLSEGLMDWTQQHTNGAAQTWEWSWCLLASLDRMILVWPAEDHGKISRVPIHKKQDQTVISKRWGR